MPVKEILQLGHPTLRARCAKVKRFGTMNLIVLVKDLRDTLYDFRTRSGFGRGIAAPQIGVKVRAVFVHVDEPIALFNPVIVKRSPKLMELWDDCFSFPNLLVKVKRNTSIEVHYQNIEGERRVLKVAGSMSELLQHEVDHLNGVLAIDRAIDSKHIVLRSEYERWLKGKKQGVNV